jgi:hypothetical protein
MKKDEEEIAICPNCIELVSHVHSGTVARVKSSKFIVYLKSSCGSLPPLTATFGGKVIFVFHFLGPLKNRYTIHQSLHRELCQKYTKRLKDF